MDLYKDKMSLTNLEKKINSELTTKINSSRINHDQLEIQINKELYFGNWILVMILMLLT